MPVSNLQYFYFYGLSVNSTKSELVGKGIQEENTHAKLLGVTVQKGYVFQKHSPMVGGTIISKAFCSCGFLKVIKEVQHDDAEVNGLEDD